MAQSPDVAQLPILDAPLDGPPPNLVHCSNRPKIVLAKIQDYVCNIVWISHSAQHAHSTSSDFSGKSRYPLTKFIDYEKFSPSHLMFLATITANIEPT